LHGIQESKISDDLFSVSEILIFLYINGLKNILPSGFFDLILNNAIIPGDTVRNGGKRAELSEIRPCV